jgi:hypothetical protein
MILIDNFPFMCLTHSRFLKKIPLQRAGYFSSIYQYLLIIHSNLVIFAEVGFTPKSHRIDPITVRILNHTSTLLTLCGESDEHLIN